MRRLAVVALLTGAGLSAARGPARPGGAPAAISEPRLQRLVGRWEVVASTFGGVAAGSPPTFVATQAALGHAVSSVWRQGTGASTYEANALWAHDSASRQVRVFEANSLGAAETHMGAFDDSGALVVELRSPDTGEVVERRAFVWSESGDTLRMTAQVRSGGRTVDHAAMLVRHP
jgi:hypothetical protein